MEDHIVARL